MKIYPEIKETLYHEVLENNTNVYIIPKKGFSYVTASYFVNYGGKHTKLRMPDQSIKEYPKGIAHFLEHKLFEQPDGVKVKDHYDERLVEWNAYTSSNITNYHIKSPDNHLENVLYLLNYVQNPYFTDQNVQEEIGIITEEIRMYQDDPYDRWHKASLGQVLMHDGSKNDILGSLQDINQITKEMLYEIHELCYHPENMTLIIIGDVEVENWLEAIRQHQKQNYRIERRKAVYVEEIEPSDIQKPYEVEHMEIDLDISGITIKLEKGPNNQKEYLYLEFLRQLGSKEGYPFMEKLKRKQIASLLYSEINYTREYALLQLYTASNCTEQLTKELSSFMTNLHPTKEQWEQFIKVRMRQLLMDWDELESVNFVIADHLDHLGTPFLEQTSVLKSLTFEEFEVWLQTKRNSRQAITIIESKKD